LSVKHKKGFTGQLVPAKPFAIRFYKPGIPARLLTFGIPPVFRLPAFRQWRCEKQIFPITAAGPSRNVTVFRSPGYLYLGLILYWMGSVPSRGRLPKQQNKAPFFAKPFKKKAGQVPESDGQAPAHDCFLTTIPPHRRRR
jgi:hypothetical protein